MNDRREEISTLLPVRVDLSDSVHVMVSFSFYMSMIDGKVLAYVTNTVSMQSCCICGAKPNQMNSLDELENGFHAI